VPLSKITLPPTFARFPVCWAAFIIALSVLVAECGLADGVNNFALIPKLLPDSQVKWEDSSPDWTKTLIMAELRVETATPEGTFQAATRTLDHYAEMGVNGLWIGPVYERGSKGNGYGNFGPDTLEPLLTEKSTTDESFAVVRQFVEEAHRRNIRVIFDIIVWGTRPESPLVSSHPEFYARKDGDFRKVWGGYAFDWNNRDLRSWFKKAAVEFIEKTGADGFRVDLAPNTSGYFFKEIRSELVARGRKPLIVSEIPNKRMETFDFEQVGVNGWTEEPNYATPGKHDEQKLRFGHHAEYLLNNNIVDTIHSGTGIGKPTLQAQGSGGMFRFYTSNLLHHDDSKPFVCGNRVRFAYASIFAPFIPMWWIGEEWNNPRVMGPDSDGVMYFNTIDWSQMAPPANRAFFEDIKKYIRIRRMYPGIFENFPDSTRKANIVKLETKRNGAPNPLQAYARTSKDQTILVVPNYKNPDRAEFEIFPDFDALGLPDALRFRIVDLMTNTVVAKGNRSDLSRFTAGIDGEQLGIFLIERD